VRGILIDSRRLSTDDFAGRLANQTNLAIKGTVGIKAMSMIAGLLGKTDVQANYSVSYSFRKAITPLRILFLQSIASSYAPQIQGFALASDGKHLELDVMPHSIFVSHSI
jgi:hypothetical protein